jgi:hypothetical protein
LEKATSVIPPFDVHDHPKRCRVELVPKRGECVFARASRVRLMSSQVVLAHIHLKDLYCGRYSNFYSSPATFADASYTFILFGVSPNGMSKAATPP